MFFEEYYIFFDESGVQNLSRCKILIMGSIIDTRLVLTPSFINFNISPENPDKPFDGHVKLRLKCQNPDYVQDLPEMEFNSYWKHNKIEYVFKEPVPEIFQVFGEISFDFIPGKPRNWGILKPTSGKIDKGDLKKSFTITCDGEKWSFDQNRLCQISPVFKAMIEHSTMIEAQENTLKIQDADIETLEIFHDLMNKWSETAIYEFCMGFTNFGKSHTNYHDEELIFNLLIFADKYLMEPLIDLCINLLTTSMSNENVLEVLKMAHYLSNQKLLKIATTFSINYQAELSESQQKEWKDFIKKNPECVSKMMTSLVLN